MANWDDDDTIIIGRKNEDGSVGASQSISATVANAGANAIQSSFPTGSDAYILAAAVLSALNSSQNPS